MKFANMTYDWGDRPDTEQMLREIRETGWEGCETRLTADWMGMPDRVRELVKKTGCEIFCLSRETAPSDVDHWYMNVLQRLIEYADAIGVRNIMFFPSGRPWGRPPTNDELGKFAEAAENLAKYAAKYGITTSFHHHSNYMVETIAESEIVLNQTETLKLCLDCYHTHIFGEDFVEAYRKWKDRVHFVHVHDGNGLKLTDLGEGIVPVKESLEGIRDLGYDGWVVTHGGTTDRSPKEKSRIRRDYLKSIGF